MDEDGLNAEQAGNLACVLPTRAAKARQAEECGYQSYTLSKRTELLTCVFQWHIPALRSKRE